MGGRKQHGGDGQAASVALPGTDAPGNHGKEWCGIMSTYICITENIKKANQLDSSPFLEKTEVFLELFGNSEIRSQTVETLKRAASQLSLSVTETQETPTHSCLDTTQLKVPFCGPQGCRFPLSF